jgi:hypothetical protein
MRYARRKVARWKYDAVVMGLAIMAFTALMATLKNTVDSHAQAPLSPIGEGIVVYLPSINDTNLVDDYVNKYADKFGKTTISRQQIKVKLHFLLYKESKYGVDTGCGDSGKACGPLQFHEATWYSYRQIMLDRGLIEEIGDRYNMEQAIETTAWAISDGRELAWGPIKRGEIDL